MTITETLNELYEILDSKGISLTDLGVDDEEDLIIMALNNLMNNIDDVLEELEIEELDMDGEELVAL